ncbi:hypothetical protein RZS08_34880, partial [Arthrospira platensis SPKY1]|nr:hypothetical protein [Arthrospira platensis SPKY1]
MITDDVSLASPVSPDADVVVKELVSSGIPCSPSPLVACPPARIPAPSALLSERRNGLYSADAP